MPRTRSRRASRRRSPTRVRRHAGPKVPTARKPSRSKLGLLVLLGALLVGGGCASLPPRKLLPPEVEAARAALGGRAKAFHDLRTQADLRIRRGDRVDRLTGVLLLRAPAELRFEALAPFGPPILVVASNADTVTLWEVAQQRAVLARSSPRSTASSKSTCATRTPSGIPDSTPS